MNSLPTRLSYAVELSYEVQTSGTDFIFNVQAARTRRQAVVSEQLWLPAGIFPQEYTDPHSHGRFLRLRAPAGAMKLSYQAVVDVYHHLGDPSSIPESPIPSIPGNVLPYLYPSRYCPSDVLNAFAMEKFGNLWQGYGRVQAICEWVSRHVSFVSGSSTGTTAADETMRTRQGVCRDFAHLMIALCRAVNIPARFTTGLDFGADPALGPPDFHAYVEAYLGGRWYLFDPSGTAIPMGFVRLTSGRDAADSAFASIFGSVRPQPSRLHIAAVPGGDGVVREPYRTWQAISTDDAGMATL
jgi:transglutaminase-like putative cysteine protease